MMELESTPLPAHGGGSKKRDVKNKEVCHKYTAMYSNKFPDIRYISSEELVELMSKNPNKEPPHQQPGGSSVVLVDVRTAPERQVSMLEGAVSKEDFLARVAATRENGNRDNEDNNDESPMIVTYCTIGYRSGLEARRLGLQYPHLKHRIASLDGIVSYTHALGESELFDTKNIISNATKQPISATSDDTTQQQSPASPPNLIHPLSGQPTTRVHVFGSMWACVDTSHFEPTHFSAPELLVRMLQVFMAIIAVFCLRLQHFFFGGGGAASQQLDKFD